MRILMIDIDTMRPDHMGCYGYARETTPCMDAIAAEGMRFTNYYTPNAPCLPSRAALSTGMYGIHNGVVGHGGTASDIRYEGSERGFNDSITDGNLFNVFRKAGYHTVSISTFAERHSSYWFYAGFNEMYNVGKGGMESAEEVTPVALKWLEDNAETDKWFLHYHLWDPHTPYRTPDAFGNPFAEVPLADNWIDEKTFAEHYQHIGPHNPQEINMWDDQVDPEYPKHPGRLDTLQDVKKFIDGYDCGVRFADDNVAQLIQVLKQKGVYEDTAIIITSDHGENLGELGIYGEHATADEMCCHIPMIVKWPGVPAGSVEESLHLNIDLAPTMAELLHVEPTPHWDGESYVDSLMQQKASSRECVVLGQCTHVCQRSVRFGDYLYIRTVHGGYHLFDDEMLFDVKNDPHEQKNLAPERRDLTNAASRMILDWEYEMMKISRSDVDPMWTVMREGGPIHSRGYLRAYVQRLRETGREEGARQLLEKYSLDVKSKYY